MKHFPPYDEFRELAGQGKLIPVYRRLVSDTLTPVTASCRLPAGACSFLFESVIGGERISRYSILGSDPLLQIVARGNELTLTSAEGVEQKTVADPLAELEDILADWQAVPLPGLPRFCGGAVGYAGYDVVRYTENLPDAPEDDRGLP
ncbi:MAG: anthranilate synthase component I, partial [Planctomycetaceae bacterium]|nr:anthranilate synthase component I [Planctomycetaceae bacterium]